MSTGCALQRQVIYIRHVYLANQAIHVFVCEVHLDFPAIV